MGMETEKERKKKRKGGMVDAMIRQMLNGQ